MNRTEALQKPGKAKVKPGWMDGALQKTQLGTSLFFAKRAEQMNWEDARRKMGEGGGVTGAAEKNCEKREREQSTGGRSSSQLPNEEFTLSRRSRSPEQ